MSFSWVKRVKELEEVKESQDEDLQYEDPIEDEFIEEEIIE